MYTTQTVCTNVTWNNIRRHYQNHYGWR